MKTILVSSLILAFAVFGQAQGTTEFNYQGRLAQSGQLLNGDYELEFTLYGTPNGGASLGSPVVRPATVSNGVFNLALDFGATPFAGDARYLEVRVRRAGTASWSSPLAPRQAIRPVPYALHASRAGTVGDNAVTTAGLQNSSVTAGKLANAAVTTAALQNNAVTAAKIAGGQVVKSVNNLKDNVTFVAGPNVTLTSDPTANQLTIGSAGSPFVLNGGSAYYNGGNVGIGTDNPQSRLQVDGTIGGAGFWIPGGAAFNADQGGSFELGPTVGGNEVPYIDFHYGSGLPQDYNVRLINNADQQLLADAHLVVTKSLEVGTSDRLGLVNAGNQVRLSYDDGLGSGPRVIGFGLDANDDPNAGKFAYRAGWAPDSLSIVGAGPRVGGPRRISLYDDVSVGGKLQASRVDASLGLLDVGENFTATVRSADFLFGHPGRKGTTTPAQPLGRALVDFGDTLVVNFASDWAKTAIGGSKVEVSGEMLRVNGNGNEQAYLGGDGAGGDVEVGSTNPNIGNVAMYNRGSGKYMDLFVGVLHIMGGADLAEPFKMSSEAPEPGSVVVIDESNAGHLKLSQEAYDSRVAGIVSGANGVNPGVSLSQQGVVEGGQPVALSGRVYVKADATATPIRPGDLLTTSSLAGHAMKANDTNRAHGAILGKAMTGLSEGTGMVLVLVSLQ